MFAFRNDSQTNSEKKDPNIEEEESSNDDLKPKQRGKKSGTRKAAVKEEEQAEDDDHGTMSLNFSIIVSWPSPHCTSLLYAVSYLPCKGHCVVKIWNYGTQV